MQADVFLKIRKETPLVTNDNNEIQFGIDEAVLKLFKPTPKEQHLLMMLQKGTTYGALVETAKNLTFNAEAISNYLSKLQPILEITRHKKVSVKPVLTILGSEPATTFLAKHFVENRWRVFIGEGKSFSHSQIIIAADRYAPDIKKHRKFLFADHKVIPIVFSDQSVLVGPVITSDTQYDIFESRCLDDKNDKFAFWVSQVCHQSAATETTSIMTIVCGLIREQLDNFYRNSNNEIKIFSLSKPATANLTIKVEDMSNSLELQEAS
ncbi:MAG TPA: hypothetical protein VLZ31_00725 [Microbacteriaceae bacterium]|nr:hypothetical protein [Microbacteriaceae bacterium]